MRKRLLLAGGTMMGLVGVVLTVLAMLPPGPGVTKANFDRIEKDMTRVEVDELFGGKKPLERIDQGWVWDADDGSEAYIAFAGGGVAAKNWLDANEPITKKIRRWLRL